MVPSLVSQLTLHCSTEKKKIKIVYQYIKIQAVILILEFMINQKIKYLFRRMFPHGNLAIYTMSLLHGH